MQYSVKAVGGGEIVMSKPTIYSHILDVFLNYALKSLLKTIFKLEATYLFLYYCNVRYSSSHLYIIFKWDITH